MANTIVTDSFKFTNVASVLNGTDSGLKKVSDEMDFTQMLGNAANDSVKMNPNDTVAKTQTIVEKSSKSNLSESNAKVNENGNDASKQEQIASKVLEKSSDIRNKIKDELGVSDEEMDDAMQALGLCPQDLLDLANVKDLMMTLSGETDSISILTNSDLYDSMKSVFDFVSTQREDIEKGLFLGKGELDNVLQDTDLFAQIADLTVDAKSRVSDASITDVKDSTITVAPSDNEAAPEFGRYSNSYANDMQQDNSRDGNLLGQETELTDDELSAIVTGNRDAETYESASFATDTNRNSLENFIQNKAGESSNGISIEVNHEKIAPVKSDSGKGDTGEGLFENNNQASGLVTTTTTTTVNTLGDMVEEIRTFSSAVNESDIINQVTSHIKLNLGTDVTSMEMQLHPASLGTVNLQVTSVNGAVTAHLTVQNEAVKAALENQLITLTQTFEEQGQKVDAVEVSVANYDMNRSLNQEGQNGRDKNDFAASKVSKRIRSINLSELDDEDVAALSEADKVSAEVMKANGTTVDFMA